MPAWQKKKSPNAQENRRPLRNARCAAGTACCQGLGLGAKGAVREVDVHAIGKRRLAAAIVGEQAVRVGRREEIEEADVVIAGQRDDAAVLIGCADQEIDHAFGVGAAVDIVAEMDDAPVGLGMLGPIPDDRVIHFQQQVEPAVHVADRIEAQSVRALRV